MRPKAFTQKQIDGGVLLRVKRGCTPLRIPEGTIGLFVRSLTRTSVQLQFERPPNGLSVPITLFWREVELVQ